MDNGLLVDKKPWYKRRWVVAVLILGVVFVALGVLFLYQAVQVYGEIKAGTFMSEQSVAPYDMAALVDSMSPSVGLASAPVVIVEFGDFNCSRCRQAMPAVKQMLAKYGDKVKFYWRHYPVIAESSADFARAGVCADQQGKFWLYHDLVLSGLPAQSGAVSAFSELTEVLPTLGIDLAKYDKCMQNKLTAAQIKKDYYAATDAGVSGTPTFFVNGYKLQGVLPFTAWEQIIKKFMAIYEKNLGN